MPLFKHQFTIWMKLLGLEPHSLLYDMVSLMENMFVVHFKKE